MNSISIGLVRGKNFLAHHISTPHPENPGRLELLPVEWVVPEGIRRVELPLTLLTEAEFGNVHVKDLWKQLQANAGKTGWLDPDTYYGPRSWEVALQAAGSSVALARKIWKGELRRGFALVRPPGHHATPMKSMGFCLMNNVAIAAAAILEEKPSAKIAIVDFDLHHGNGTQDIFYEDDRVLFISSHRFPYYPGTGAMAERGAGKGLGTTFNFPVGEPEGDRFFSGLYQELVAPLLRQFRPDIILVSAGFDGHRDDPMQGLSMETETFARLAEILVEVAEAESDGKILFCLEGGYNPQALVDCAQAVWKVLTGAKIPGNPAGPTPSFREWDIYRKFFQL